MAKKRGGCNNGKKKTDPKKGGGGGGGGGNGDSLPCPAEHPDCKKGGTCKNALPCDNHKCDKCGGEW